MRKMQAKNHEAAVLDVTAGKLAVGLYAAYEAEHRADGVAQLCRRVEVRGHEAGCFVYSGQPLALGGSCNGG